MSEVATCRLKSYQVNHPGHSGKHTLCLLKGYDYNGECQLNTT